MRCPNCAADMNPLREFCPSCGKSVHALRDERPRSGPGGRPPEELQRNRKTVLIVAAGIVLMLAIGGRFSLPTIPIHFDSRHDRARTPVTIAAAELFEAYHTDSATADRRFGGREMVISGQFVRTVPDGYGSIDMRLKTAHPDTPLGIDLDGVSVAEATRLAPGQNVTVSCRRVAGTGDDPWLQDCVIQPPAEDSAVASTPRPPAPPPPPPAPTGDHGG